MMPIMLRDCISRNWGYIIGVIYTGSMIICCSFRRSFVYRR